MVKTRQKVLVIGKTKVMSLLLIWSYFNRTYENNSELSGNFLIIAPNIIVLDRLKNDFENLNVSRNDHVYLNGYHNQNWKIDFFSNIDIHSKAVRVKKTRKYFFNKYTANLCW